MTMPDVGTVTAPTVRPAIADAERFLVFDGGRRFGEAHPKPATQSSDRDIMGQNVV